LHEQIWYVLNFAVIAPSTHNIQPWLFKVKDNFCELYLDKKLRLFQADPTGRDAFISLGCCFENLIIASRAWKILDRFECTVDEKSGLIARIYFKPAALSPDQESRSWINAMTERFDARGMFSAPETLPDFYMAAASQLNDFSDLRLDIVTDREKIEQLANLTAQGLRSAHRHPEFRRELSHWMTNSSTRRRDGMPGFSMRIPFLASFLLPWLIKFINFSSILSKLNYKSVVSATGLAIVSTSQDNCRSWFDVGRLSERLMLKNFILGYKNSIYIAAVEIDENYRTVQKILSTDLRPQFLFCFGPMPLKIKEVPRWHPSQKMFKD